MKKIITKLLEISLILTIMVICGIINYEKPSIMASTGVISNQKIGWGLKRASDHKQPDLGATNKRIIEKYDGIAMGNKNKKYIYLTFDNGYEAGYTGKILDTLKENEVKATFFITAHYLNSAGDLVKRMIDEGHIVGNHTVNHKCMPDLSENQIKEEVMKLHMVVYEKYGYEMKYIRPPKGEFSERTLCLTNSLGYRTVMWSMAYDDWDEKKQGREEYGKEKILSNIHPGCVMLLHATSKDNSEILGDVIKEIKKQGYEFRSIEDFEK